MSCVCVCCEPVHAVFVCLCWRSGSWQMCCSCIAMCGHLLTPVCTQNLQRFASGCPSLYYLCFRGHGRACRMQTCGWITPPLVCASTASWLIVRLVQGICFVVWMFCFISSNKCLVCSSARWCARLRVQDSLLWRVHC